MFGMDSSTIRKHKMWKNTDVFYKERDKTTTDKKA